MRKAVTWRYEYGDNLSSVEESGSEAISKILRSILHMEGLNPHWPDRKLYLIDPRNYQS